MTPELETAAEALYLEGCRRAIAVGMMKDPPPAFTEIAESSRRDYRLSAGAVIRSIRQPSDETMLPGVLDTHDNARDTWESVIDAILES